ncbi:MAG TPA: UvrD-helicase domain-containing protein [Isosphaeraceae bacterium]
MELTAQQRAALDVVGASVVLATGAGCGKTRVLTEKYVEALSARRVPVGRMVALTFTDKAAAELRRRVRQACRERLDAGEDVDYWRDVLRALEAAPIGTFHTFCGEVVRRFAVRAGVDPGFAILDESVAATCREEAVDAAIRMSLVARDEHLRALVAALNLGAIRDHLVDLLADRSAESLDAWAAADPTDLVERWRAAFQVKGRPAAIAGFLDASRPCLQMIETRREGFPARMGEALAAIVDKLGKIASSDGPEDILDEVREHAKMPRGIGPGKWPDPGLYETCKETFGRFRDLVDRALADLTADDASTDVAAHLGISMARLAAKARGEFAAVKRRRGVLDFDDLLLTARDLLRDDDGPVREDLGRRYDLILVDEFQDTDPIQDEIVRRIAGEDLAGGRLFLVGDAKQSIYGFRGARPDLFERYHAEFPGEGRLRLTENFRSRRGVIDFVNALFADAFPEYEPIEAAGPDVLDETIPSVVFAWPPPEEVDAPKTSARRTLRKDQRQLEAARLARLVRSWIDEGRPVRAPETGEPRPMRAHDVAFLFRTLNDSSAYERALAEEGLDYYVVGGSAFYAQGEVQDVINVLAVIDDPHDSVALAGALRGPFFGLSDEALFWLSTVRRDDLFAGLAQFDGATTPDLAPDDRAPARRAFELLTRWRSLKDREPIARLLERVLAESGFEAAILGEWLGDRKRANARKLVRMARAFDEPGRFALADFVARLRADLNSPPREEQAATTGELGEVVRLMTVHKAKGLEFPVVILPDLDRKVDGARGSLALHPELGPVLKVKADVGDDEEVRASLGWLVHRRIAEAEEAAEALRVLYVATTRARDLLVLSTSGEPVWDQKKPAMKLLMSRFDAETGACRVRLPAGFTEPRVEVAREVPERLGKGIRRRRPALRAIARVIEDSLSVVDRSTPHTDPRPQGGRAMAGGTGRRLAPPAYLSLDSNHLAPSAARLDRLVRALWLDKRVFAQRALERIAQEVARRQLPMAPPRLVVEAIARVRPFVESPLGRHIANSKDVRRDLAWSTVRDDTTISGRLDLAFRDDDGAWVLVHVEDANTPGAIMRLRLALSARLAPALGCGAIARGWILAHGPGGGLMGEDRLDDAVVAAWLEAASSFR